jgi:gamma-glutamyltranspeptidase/glutathione hydrolase
MLAIGGAGGRRIPNAMLQVLVHLLAEGRSLSDSVRAPRIHTEGDTNVFTAPGFAQSDLNYLRQIGYTIKPPQNSFISAVQLETGKDGRGKLTAVGDNFAERSVPIGKRVEK